MKYIVYLTINTYNNNIYIGKHGVQDPDIFDGYLGCGVNCWKSWTYKRPKTAFQYAVQKYGPKYFKRTTLAVFDTAKEAYDLEAIIVNKNFIKRRDVYNMTVGGLLPPDSSIEIHQYSLSGDYIKTWVNAEEAAKYFNTQNNAIRGAVNFKTTSCGYLWSEEYVDFLDISQYTVTKSHDAVYKYDEQNNLLETFPTASAAAKAANTNLRDILHAIKGKTRSKGFYNSNDNNYEIDPKKYSKVSSVYLYHLDGSFFKEFNSPSECCRFFGTKHTSGVYRSLRTEGLYKGYQISTIKHDCMKSLENPKTPKQIAQYDLNGNLIKVFDCIAEARRLYGTGVCKCLKGHQHQTKGFKFKYV